MMVSVGSGNSALLLKFKDDGKYIKIMSSKRLTRSDILALIKEAQKRNRIVDLSGRDLSGLDLRNLSLGRANISNTNLSNSNLSNSTLFAADLSNSDLSNVDLSYADLSYANLFNAKTEKAILLGTNLFRTTMP